MMLIKRSGLEAVLSKEQSGVLQMAAIGMLENCCMGQNGSL
jgi:hypothetical protein